jgi:hypothetical protein
MPCLVLVGRRCRQFERFIVGFVRQAPDAYTGV